MVHVIAIRNSRSSDSVYEAINQDMNTLYEQFARIHFVSARDKKFKRVWQIICGIKLTFVLLQVKKEDVLILRYPFEKLYMGVALGIKRIKGYRTALIIEDVNFMRYDFNIESEEYKRGCKELGKHEIILAQTQDFIKAIEKDINSRFICFDVIPYLMRQEPIIDERNLGEIHIGFHGNLNKAGFLNHIEPSNYILHLSGESNERLIEYINNTPNIFFEKMAELDKENPSAMTKYDFGLVWDGETFDIEEKGVGNYLRYAAPYKISNYLAHGLPVIAWSESAMANFIIKNRIGIVISSIKDLEEAMATISEREYKVLRNNAVKIGAKIRTGEHFLKIIEKLDSI